MTLRRLVLATALVTVLTLSVAGPANAQAPTEAALTGATQVSAGGFHSCARFANGQVQCWGSNYDGEAGVGTQGNSPMPPTTVLAPSGAGPLTGVVQIEAGFYHTCALLGSGQVRCWGYNGEGQVGNGSPLDYMLRAKVVSNPAGTGPLTGVTQITAGERHTCARLNTGQLRCWGENGGGEVGDGTAVFERPRPRVVLNVAGNGPLTGVTQVDAGDSATCARLANGQARCWGVGNSGVLGHGTNTGSNLPVVVENQAGGGPLTGVSQVAVDLSNACARLANGQARCWGHNDAGQNGDGTMTQHFLPVTVRNVGGGGPLTGVTRIDVGGGHACARIANGQARCWGRGDEGQLGWDALSGNLLPRVVVNPQANGPLLNVRQIRTGALHTCAVLVNGQLRCWGHNDNSQVGDGTSGTDRDRPRIVVS